MRWASNPRWGYVLKCLSSFKDTTTLLSSIDCRYYHCYCCYSIAIAFAFANLQIYIAIAFAFAFANLQICIAIAFAFALLLLVYLLKFNTVQCIKSKLCQNWGKFTCIPSNITKKYPKVYWDNRYIANASCRSSMHVLVSTVLFSVQMFSRVYSRLFLLGKQAIPSRLWNIWFSYNIWLLEDFHRRFYQRKVSF